MKILKTLFLFFIITINAFVFAEDNKQFCIMLDPAGHAKNVGRTLCNGYERAETYKFAEELSNILKEKYGFKVILTRVPGDEIVPLQNASFANRLDYTYTIDLFLGINIYKEDSIKPQIYAYQLVFDPIVDFAPHKFNKLSFTSIHQAHYKNIDKTKKVGNLIKGKLSNPEYQKQFDFYGLFGLPIKPLIGIVPPSVVLEFGLNEDDKWKTFINPLAEAISFAVKSN